MTRPDRHTTRTASYHFGVEQYHYLRNKLVPHLGYVWPAVFEGFCDKMREQDGEEKRAYMAEMGTVMFISYEFGVDLHEKFAYISKECKLDKKHVCAGVIEAALFNAQAPRATISERAVHRMKRGNNASIGLSITAPGLDLHDPPIGCRSISAIDSDNLDTTQPKAIMCVSGRDPVDGGIQFHNGLGEPVVLDNENKKPVHRARRGRPKKQRVHLQVPNELASAGTMLAPVV